MYFVGRSLQMAGLIILPFAILLELQAQVDLKQSLAVSAFGVLLFGLGYLLQGFGQRPS